MRYLPAVFFVCICFAVASCDAIADAVFPYGEGNGKLVVSSDIASATRIDVSLAGESAGSITRFPACPGDPDNESGLATIIKPAGVYQGRGTTANGASVSFTARITANEKTVVPLRGRPSAYDVNIPDSISGIEVIQPSTSAFQVTTSGNDEAEFVVTDPGVNQGDRISLAFNGRLVASSAALTSGGFRVPITLSPGANWIMATVDQDIGSRGIGNSDVYLSKPDQGRRYEIQFVNSSQWRGFYVRYDC